MIFWILELWGNLTSGKVTADFEYDEQNLASNTEKNHDDNATFYSRIKNLVQLTGYSVILSGSDLRWDIRGLQ